MKKIISMIMILFLLTSSVCAQDKPIHQYMTIHNKRVEEYVINNIEIFIRANQYNFDIEEINVGKGLYIFNSNNQYIYPIYRNDICIATFEVIKYDNDFTGCYSKNYCDYINEYRNTLRDFYIEEDCLYLETDSMVINITNHKIEDKEVKEFEEFELVQTNDYVNISKGPSLPTTYHYASWSTIVNYTNSGVYCVPLCLYNIFRNYGIYNYTSFSQVNQDIASVNNINTISLFYERYQIDNYLNSKGLIHAPHSTSGKTPLNSLNSVADSNRYILAFSSGYDSQGYLRKHATVIIGTAVTNGNAVVKMFDPHGSGDGIVYFSYNTPTFTSTSISYTWNLGYCSYIHTYY